jgi:hypothetical protein
MNRIRITALAAAAVLCMSVGSTAIAGAAGGTEKVTIKYNGDGFQGKIKNAKPKCLKDRTVNVLKNGVKVYTDTTEDDGTWNTGNSGQTSGTFKAKVKAKGNCAALTSRSISV